MSRKVKRGSYVVLFSILFLGLIIAVSYVRSQINIKGQDNNIIDVEIQADVDEKEVDKLIAEAQALNKLGTKPEALTLFEEIIKKYPNSDKLPKIYLRLGGIAHQIEQPEKAVQFFQKIINTAPDYSPMRVLYQLGHARAALEDYSGALAAYQEIIDRWPDTEMALKTGNTKGTLHYNLARRGIDSSHYNKAIAEYRKVIAHDVDTTNHHHKWKAIVTYRIGMTYFAMNRYNEAIAAFQNRLNQYGPLDNAQYRMAQAYRKARRYPEAISAFAKVVSMYPSYQFASTAQYWTGELQEIQGNFSQAKQAYQRTQELYPNSDSARSAANRLKMIATGENPIFKPNRR